MQVTYSQYFYTLNNGWGIKKHNKNNYSQQGGPGERALCSVSDEDTAGIRPVAVSSSAAPKAARLPP